MYVFTVGPPLTWQLIQSLGSMAFMLVLVLVLVLILVLVLALALVFGCLDGLGVSWGVFVSACPCVCVANH